MGPRKGMRERIMSFALRLSDEDLKIASDTFSRQGPAIWGYWCKAMDARRKAGLSVPSYMQPRKNPSESPRIYVANLAAYNAGRLKGRWIEPSTDSEELSQQVVDAIGGNPDHEWAFHDYDGFPDMGENPDLEDVAAMAELLEEHPRHVIEAAQDFVGSGDLDGLKQWLDAGYGVFDSEREYAEQYIDDMGGPSGLGKTVLERYFDYDAYARDLFHEIASARTSEGIIVFNAR